MPWPSSSPAFKFPTGATAAEGDFLYVSYQEEDFESFFGFAPDFFGTSVVNFNGDDALLLYNDHGSGSSSSGSTTSSGASSADPVVVDVLGTPNATAASVGWAYADGWVYRRNGTEPSGSKFQTSQWSLNHQSSLTSFTNNADALAAGLGFPIGTYEAEGFSPMAGCALVDPCPCHVVTDHVAINCSTVPGAGAGHAWVVSVAEQESTAATTAYGVPVVHYLSGPGSGSNASTYGAQEVTLTGANFGPIKGAGVNGNSSFLEAVTYGPGGTEYAAEGCEVTVGHTEIVCLTVAGVGPDLHWVVTVDKQTSLASQRTSGYASPSLLGIFPQHVPTQGGSRHVINGTDLGMASGDAYLQVFLDGVPLDVDGAGSLSTTVFPASSELMTSKAVAGWSSSSSSSSPRYWEALEIVMPPLEDETHDKELVVVVGHRRFGGATATSKAVEAKYKPPRLNEVQNSPGGLEGTQQVSLLLLIGSNFGSVGTVQLGGSEVDASRISSWSDDQIELSVVAAFGNITVVVGDYKSATLPFDDFSPILLSLDGYLPDPAGYRTDARAEPEVIPSDFANYADFVAVVNAGLNSNRNLSLAGVYFGSNEDVLEVTIVAAGSGSSGGGSGAAAVCPIWPGSLMPIASSLSSETVRALTCKLPPGTGASNRVVLSRSSKSSFVANTTQQLAVAYHPPTITGVEPRRVHTSGGEAVTITGVVGRIVPCPVCLFFPLLLTVAYPFDAILFLFFVCSCFLKFLHMAYKKCLIDCFYNSSSLPSYAFFFFFFFVSQGGTLEPSVGWAFSTVPPLPLKSRWTRLPFCQLTWKSPCQQATGRESS
jgi:hypothetical protein